MGMVNIVMIVVGVLNNWHRRRSDTSVTDLI